MEGQLIDVYVEIDDQESENIIVLAKIIKDYEDKIEIKYLSEIGKKYEDQVVYNFDEEVSEIYKESISGYYDSTEMECAGYVFIQDVGYLRIEDLDSDYSPSDDE